MSREDFVKREYSRYGHTYKMTENGDILKDGKTCPTAKVRIADNGQFWIFDDDKGIGKMKEHFGFYCNCTGTTETIGSKEIKIANGYIEEIFRTVYRTPDRGMFCQDAHMIFKPDKLTLVSSYVKPAPFEILK